MKEQQELPLIDIPGILIQRDKEGNIVHLNHLRAPVVNSDPTATPRSIARWYITNLQGPSGYNLTNIDLRLRGPKLRPNRNRLDKEASVLSYSSLKNLRGTHVATFQQTLFGIEIWDATFSVTVQKDRTTNLKYVAGSDCSLRRNIADEPTVHPPKPTDPYLPRRLDEKTLTGILQLASSNYIARIDSSRLLIYRYDPSTRLKTPPKDHEKSRRILEDAHLSYFRPSPPHDELKPNAHYVVSEVIFSTRVPKSEMEIGWRAFIEVQHGTVLQLWPFVTGCMAEMFPKSVTSAASAGARGRIMCKDPLSSNGLNPIPAGASPANEAALDTAIDAYCHDSSLDDLIMQPEQLLEGNFVALTNQGLVPDIILPEETRGAAAPRFAYSPYSDGQRFAAVNAYYHCESLFRMMQRLGFSSLKSRYFRNIGDANHKGLMLMIDSLGWLENDERIGAWTLYYEENGHIYPTVVFGSTQHDTPVGIATDIRVVLHEFSHLLLLASTGDLNFGFAHSAGDSLSTILLDPGSHLRDAGPDRFATFPWHRVLNPQVDPATVRYHGGSIDQRDNAQQWGWQSNKYLADDYYGYITEQVLSITLFQLYRSLGGDSTDEKRRRFAARYAAYLIIQAIGTHTRSGMLDNFVSQLQAADRSIAQFNDDELGKITAGVAQKVIRWAFERRGYQINGPTMTPASDVYINDGRNGEYNYTEDFSQTEIWNRVAASAAAATPGSNPVLLNNHQPPSTAPGNKNFIYTRVNNLGQSQAQSVTVKGYYRTIPAGSNPKDLLWDNNWTPMTPAPGIRANANGSMAGGGSATVGPFGWNAGNHGDRVCILISVSAADDPSGLDPHPTSASFPFALHPVPLWWLVPLDNNIASKVMVV